MTVRLLSHDPVWASAYRAEIDRITAAVVPHLVRAHHIGSTSIPGMSAKPIIDILLEVRSLRGLDDMAEAMRNLGYEVLGEFGLPGRRYFRRSAESGDRTHHVHAFEVGSPHVERHLAFRDYLRSHADAAADYEVLKRGLAVTFADDREGYQAGKAPFIESVEARAIAWARARARLGRAVR